MRELRPAANTVEPRPSYSRVGLSRSSPQPAWGPARIVLSGGLLHELWSVRAARSADNNGVPGIVTDASRWPLVVITFAPDFTDDDLARCFEDNARLFMRGQRFATVRDMRHLTQMPSPMQREMARKWQVRVRDELPRNCLGVAIVNDRSFIRHLITAVSWATAPPIPEEAVPTVSKGIDWAIQRLDEGGVFVPTSLRRYAVEVSDQEDGQAQVSPGPR